MMFFKNGRASPLSTRYYTQRYAVTLVCINLFADVVWMPDRLFSVSPVRSSDAPLLRFE